MTERGRGLAAALVLLAAAPAPAQEQPMRYGVELRTIGQSYRWRDSGGNLVSGARIAQHLGLTVTNIGGRATLIAALRLDADAGLTPAEAARFEGALATSLSLMYGWLDWPDVVPRLDLQVGRLFAMDAADFFSFDGARVSYRFHLPFIPGAHGEYSVGAFAGIEARNFAPPGAALYELDGVRGVRDLAAGGAPAADPLAPVWGVTVAYNDLPRLELRIGLRHLLRVPTAAENALLPEAMRRAFYTEAFTMTFSGALRPVQSLRAYASAAADLGAGFLSRALAGVAVRASDDLDLVAELLRQEPSFALSSIWTYFSHQAMDELSVGAGWRKAALALEGRLFARALRSPKGIERIADPAFTSAQIPLYDALGVRQALGGRVAARTFGDRWAADGGVAGHAVVGLGSASTLGGGGRRLTVDAGGRWDVLDRIALDGRATLVAYDDEVRPGPDGTAEKGLSVGLSAGATWAIAGDTTLSLVLEENFTTFARRPPARVFVFFDLGRWL